MAQERTRPLLEADYLALLESVHAIVWRADARTFHTTFATKAAEELLGYPLAAWTSDPAFWQTHIHPDDHDWVLAFTARETAAGRRHDFEYRMIAADGQTVWVRNIVNVIMQDGEPSELVGVTVDVTPRKRAELEADELRQALARVTRASTLGEVTATLAHELNQPLGAIVSNAETAQMLLAEDGTAEGTPLASLLDDIRVDAQRAGEILHRVHAFMRWQRIDRQRLDIAALIDAVMRTMRGVLAALRVEWSVDVAASLPEVSGDVVQIQQVLVNLIRNATEAMAECDPSSRRLFVRATCHGGDCVEFAVADTGPGIAADLLPRIFDPFTSTRPGGIGMGLAISRRIVEGHDGTIRAQNNPSGGTTISFTIPAHRPAPGELDAS